MEELPRIEPLDLIIRRVNLILHYTRIVKLYIINSFLKLCLLSVLSVIIVFICQFYVMEMPLLSTKNVVDTFTCISLIILNYENNL